jgi:MoaA/NifB/PqqE/SkfB family radical SAM enzyme
MQLRCLMNLSSDRLHALPIAILYITDRCNSRCVTCDYWRFGRSEMSMELVDRLARELPVCGTRYVLLSGGEPLQHPQWRRIVSKFKSAGMKVGMVTSGILLPGAASEVEKQVDEIYVSLDGATAESYQAIRGVDGLKLVGQGVRVLSGKLAVVLRTTVQRGNYREMPDLIRLGKSWGAAHHSFLAVDVATHAAFARAKDFDRSMALEADDLDLFARQLDRVEQEFGSEFSTGYLLESPAKLRRLHGYFAALLGLSDFPAVRCNAPLFSAVIETTGSLKPCFFLPSTGALDGGSVLDCLNAPSALELRRMQRAGKREECARCVCPAYKSARALAGGV